MNQDTQGREQEQEQEHGSNQKPNSCVDAQEDDDACGVALQEREDAQSSDLEPELLPVEAQEPPSTAPEQQIGPVRIREAVLSDTEQHELNQAKKFCSASMICAIVSLFIGGMLLSTVGVVCGVIAFRKLAKHAKGTGDSATIASAMKRTAMTSIIFGGVSFALNAFAAWQMMPMLIDAMNTGNLGVSSGGTGMAQNSTWG